MGQSVMDWHRFPLDKWPSVRLRNPREPTPSAAAHPAARNDATLDSHPHALLRIPLMPSPIRTLLLPSELHGSHQHYYHFLLGNVLPLFALPAAFRESREWMFCDPGPLAPLLVELGVEPIAHRSFRSLTRSLRKRSLWPRSEFLADRYRHLAHSVPLPLDLGLEAMRLEGFDTPGTDAPPGIQRGVQGVLERLGRRAPPSTDILLVDRGDPDPFYRTRAVNRGSGNRRRSLPNLAEIGAALADELGASVTTVRLEGLGLGEQIDLFAGARLVVAQHGAALANLVWCSPQTRVLEIVPRQPIGVDLDYFKRLANGFGLRYLRVEQNGLHAAVAPQAIVPAARALLEAEPARSG